MSEERHAQQFDDLAARAADLGLLRPDEAGALAGDPCERLTALVDLLLVRVRARQGALWEERPNRAHRRGVSPHFSNVR